MKSLPPRFGGFCWVLLKTVTLTSLFRFDLMPEIMSRRDFWKSEIPIVLYCRVCVVVVVALALALVLLNYAPCRGTRGRAARTWLSFERHATAHRPRWAEVTNRIQLKLKRSPSL